MSQDLCAFAENLERKEQNDLLDLGWELASQVCARPAPAFKADLRARLLALYTQERDKENGMIRRLGFRTVRVGVAIILLPLLVVACIQAAAILRAQIAVRAAAQAAMRYAVGGLYDEAYCSQVAPVLQQRDIQEGNLPPGDYAEWDLADGVANCRVPPDAPGVDENPDSYWYHDNIGARLQDAARLHSIQNEVANMLRNASNLHVVICSTREGFSFDPERNVCFPRDDAGGPGDGVIVSVTLDQPMLSPLRGFAESTLARANARGVVERFRTARVVGLPPVYGVQETPNPTSNPGQPDLIEAAGQAQMLVVEAYLQLIVADVKSAAVQVPALTQQAGGYVASSELVDDGKAQRATFHLRVPATQFASMMNHLRALSLRVVQETTSGHDVSDEYIDLEARLRNLEVTAERVRELLKDAQSVEEALHVNAELSRIEEQIEQTKGRMQYIENRVEYATITLSLEAQPIEAAPSAWNPTSTFVQAVRLWGAILRFVGEVLIWLLMLGLPVAIPVLVFRWVKSHRRGGKGLPPSPGVE